MGAEELHIPSFQDMYFNDVCVITTIMVSILHIRMNMLLFYHSLFWLSMLHKGLLPISLNVYTKQIALGINLSIMTEDFLCFGALLCNDIKLQKHRNLRTHINPKREFPLQEKL